MIHVQEFRIGNYLLADQNMQRICLINNDAGPNANPGVGYEYEGDCRYEDQSSERLEAVPLTEKLLQQLGFRYHPYFKLWQRNRPEGTYSIELDPDYSALDFSHRPILKHIRYLHILQNLFFIIQGEELIQYKLPGADNYLETAGLKLDFVSST